MGPSAVMRVGGTGIDAKVAPLYATMRPSVRDIKPLGSVPLAPSTGALGSTAAGAGAAALAPPSTSHGDRAEKSGGALGCAGWVVPLCVTRKLQSALLEDTRPP